MCRVEESKREGEREREREHGSGHNKVTDCNKLRGRTIKNLISYENDNALPIWPNSDLLLVVNLETSHQLLTCFVHLSHG